MPAAFPWPSPARSRRPATSRKKFGHKPQEIRTTAAVHFDKTEQGWGITRIDLATEGNVPGVDEATFKRLAEDAKKTCPVSKALAATPITLQATLRSGVAA